ncbi:MAG: hypothetical protein UZ18_ATM001002422 [Armatimonadetes bacterium OLB18]|nr:MAG: hypothetical protein UZ18_ATM001002422 [Armatimonadetes bacterium OLB18]
MKAVYLETSSLLAWLFSESNAKAIARALSKAEAICTSTLTLLEAKRSLIRQESLKRITSAQRSQSLGLLEQASRYWFLMEINFPVKNAPRKASRSNRYEAWMRFTWRRRCNSLRYTPIWNFLP